MPMALRWTRIGLLATALAACLSTALAYGACGDSILDPGEGCDDGNLTDGDCCSSSCQPEPALPCPDDGSQCTTDVCSDGVCKHEPMLPDFLPYTGLTTLTFKNDPIDANDSLKFKSRGGGVYFNPGQRTFTFC